MSRNRYTRVVRACEHEQRGRQEKELAAVARMAHQPYSEPTMLVVSEAKQQRRVRLVNKRRYKTTPVAAAALIALATVLTACSTSSPRGELAENQQILKSCDPSAPPASLVELDGTGSSNADTIIAERMTAVESIVRKTAICSGELRVLVFSSSSAATATLFDGPLHLDGATDNARLKRVPSVVEDVMTKIRKAYGPAVAGLDGSGSDITAQYRLAGEWINQLGGKARLHLYLLTDGFQNIGVDLDARALSKAEAIALANQVKVPQLPGASVIVAGLGKVAGAPPRSDVVEGLISYYSELCHNTSAASCLSVTDYTPEGR